jgi:23S rRNA (pseudouridine1915-N3)-methyltransferase
MSYIIGAIGAPDAHLLPLIQSYEKRLSGSLKWHCQKKPGTLKDQTAFLQKVMDKAGHIIALDETGDALNSIELATHIQQQQSQGHVPVAFLIGGAEGFDPIIRQQAHKLISFGKLTWPHQMVKLMLVEQIYRAQTIMAGHPYHK